MSATGNSLLLDQLRELGVVEIETLDEAQAVSVEENVPLGEVLVRWDVLSDDNLAKVMSEMYSLPLVRLRDVAINSDVVNLIPERMARGQGVLVFQESTESVSVAVLDPRDLLLREMLVRKFGKRVDVFVTTERDLEIGLGAYHHEVEKEFAKVLEVYHAGDKSSRAPIISLVDVILRLAHERKASDVHIEAWPKDALVRFRIDGVMHDIERLPIDLHAQIVMRVKVMADLRTDEHQAAQDGKLRWVAPSGEEVDVRISVVPAVHGEKVVMRMLSARSREYGLQDLGMMDGDLELVRQAYTQPHGLILATGPTGSGKTTTMYSLLKILNQRDVNISTIEDPVEYAIDGVTQIQVNPKTNLTFAKGLRSLLRQDPDVLLVGEVRDEETAGIAVNSAMTGHLVLSTLHTNDAATAIPRLMEMGVEPFLIASTIKVIVAQRLVRRIHRPARYSIDVDLESITSKLNPKLVQKVLGKKKKVRVYTGKPTPANSNTGYAGRVGIYEVLVMTDAIREAVMKREDANTIRELAIKEGMVTLAEDGLEKVKQGLTTVEEILRVIRE